jgi:hypothetical protein
MKKQLQTRIKQGPKRRIYNNLDARVYRICTRPSSLDELKEGVASSVVTPFGEIAPVRITFSEREINISFRHDMKNVTETCTLPSDNYGIFYGLGRSSCGKFSWCTRKYNARGRTQLIINKKYYTDDEPVKKKSKKKRKIQETNEALIGITQKRVSKKPKDFTPNFEKPSSSSYY